MKETEEIEKNEFEMEIDGEKQIAEENSKENISCTTGTTVSECAEIDRTGILVKKVEGECYNQDQEVILAYLTTYRRNIERIFAAIFY